MYLSQHPTKMNNIRYMYLPKHQTMMKKHQTSLIFQPEDYVSISTNVAEYKEKRSCWKKEDHVCLITWPLPKPSNAQMSSAHVLDTVMPNVQKSVSLAWVGCWLASLCALPK
jgi:hypothetical protein